MAVRGQQWYIHDEQDVNKRRCQEEAALKSQIEPFTRFTVHHHGASQPCDPGDRAKHSHYENGALIQ
jgi:hypothetical protein